MLLDGFKREVARSIKEIVKSLYGIDIEPRFTEPPSYEVADIATPIGFMLAKKLKRPPEEIAKNIAERLSAEFIERVSVARGYINVKLSKLYALRDLTEELRGDPLRSEPKEEKIIVEHTNINPNKAAHIGHVRNAVLGDSLVRLLRKAGYSVEVHNYIDDTGVQVADTVVGLRFLEGKREEDLEGLEPLDKYTRSLYAKVNRLYEEDPSLLEKQRLVLKEIERGSSELARFAKKVAERICKRHLETMYRLGIEYDLLTRESDIIRLGLAKLALEALLDKGIAKEGEGDFEGAIVIVLPKSFKAIEKGSKVLVRRDGTYTYLLKDIGYTLRKFGLTEKDFLYKLFMRYPSGRELRSTAREGEKKPFGRGDVVINVIDIRQGILQDIIKYALESLGYGEKRFIHYAYGVVYLSKKTAERFGIKSEKKIVKMSGRKGIGIIADELMDEIERIVYENVKSRHPEIRDEEAKEISRGVMIGAIRYMMLKYDRLKPIVFDLEEALSLSGESGPYIQYSLTRAKGILKKVPPEEVDYSKAFLCEKERPLVRLMIEIRERFLKAVEELDPQVLAKYAYELALRFNEFYESCPVKDSESRGVRRLIVENFVRAMSIILEILGIPILEVMRCGFILSITEDTTSASSLFSP